MAGETTTVQDANYGIDAVAAIRKAAARQLNAALDVVPEDDDDAPKKISSARMSEVP